MAPELIVGKVATAAVGPALIGAGLELWIRRPPAVVGGRDWPVVGRWRDFPMVGYLVVMLIGFALSFDHLRSLAELVGVPYWAAWLLPVGIDLAAISVTFDHAQSKRALERLDADQLDAEQVARVEAEHAEAARVGSERRAQVEAEREAAELARAELEARAEADRRAVAEAEADAERARLEAERIEAERCEAEPRRVRLDARGTAVLNGHGSGPDNPAADAVAAGAGNGSRASKQDLARDWLAEFGVGSTNAEVIAGLGWAGNAGDRKAIQRARASLKPSASDPDHSDQRDTDRVEVPS